MAAPKVFISYSYNDIEWVSAFAEALRGHNIDVWFNQWQRALDDSVRDAIEYGLRESNAIVVVVSRSNAHNPNILFELGVAIGMGKRLIPVLAADLETSLIPFDLRARRYLTRESPAETARVVSMELEDLSAEPPRRERERYSRGDPLQNTIDPYRQNAISPLRQQQRKSSLLELIDSNNPDGMIADVVIRRLQVNRDPRGILVEALRTDWNDVINQSDRFFAQTYYSLTRPGVARDEDRWHYHQRQEDRFVVPQGNILLALYDARQDSLTRDRLNLIPMGEDNGDDGQLLVVVPTGVYHCYLVIGDHPALVLNYPTSLYNPQDEYRVSFHEANVRFENGAAFSWDLVRMAYGLPLVGSSRAY